MVSIPYSVGSRSGQIAAAIALAIAPTITSTEVAVATPATHRMILLSTMHTCDFQSVDHAIGRPGAIPLAEISSSRDTATAHIDMTSGTLNIEYVVRLIPAPHATLGCQAGDPSITTGKLSTDGSGTGNATLQAHIAPGTTGMWIAVDLPAAHSQTPEEFYSSNYIAAV